MVIVINRLRQIRLTKAIKEPLNLSETISLCCSHKLPVGKNAQGLCFSKLAFELIPLKGEELVF